MTRSIMVVIEAEVDFIETHQDFVDVVSKMAPYYYDNVMVRSEVKKPGDDWEEGFYEYISHNDEGVNKEENS